MNLEYNVFSIVLLISGLAAFFMSVMVFQRMGGAVRWFGFTMTLIAIWAITYGFELSSTTLEQMLFWINLEYIGIALLPAIWIIFIIKFIGKDKWLTRINTILIFIPAILTLIFVWTNKWHHLHYSSVDIDTTGPFPLLKFERGIWYWIHTVYFYVLLFWGLCLMISKFRKADDIYRKQNNIILIGALGPWLVNLIYLIGIRPFEYIDLTPYA
ncbi:MAG TPA: PAS domain-containing sensor histidine kinase, partial [Sphingobacteriaceae bacterium]|nr:PAS domain-containing sensor histidine kinase [Sphingobacteriaceae bacterium]